MKNDQYFPHDATAGNNLKLMVLIEEEGARGYGVYWYLLEFLRQQKEYKGELKMLDMLARRVKTTRAVVKRIITNYALFAVEEGRFYSPGLVERMQPLDSKREAKSEQCRRAAGAKWLKNRDDNDAGALQEENRREEKSISSSNSSYPLAERGGRGEQKEEREEGGGELKTPPDYAHSRATHNLEGLLQSLDTLGIRDPKEVNAILSLSDYGKLGGVVWHLLYHTKWGKIQQPGRFLIAGIRKEGG